MADNAAIALDDVTIRYGTLIAVERLTLNIRHGEIFGLLGPNGSGKSSTLSAVAGLLQPAGGSIRVEGICRREQPADYARRVGFVPQEPAVYDELAAFDNLSFFALLYDIHGRERKRRVERILEQVGLSGQTRKRVAEFSGGMKRRLNLAAALLHDPAVLLLDEPSVALDHASRDVLFEILNDLREQGRAILLTTHQLEEAERWCDRVGVLRQGRLISVGRPAETLHAKSEKSTLLGVLSEEMSERTQGRLRRRLPNDVDLRIEGRQLRITARNGEQLGMSLASLAAEGIVLESFRSPPARMEPALPAVEPWTATMPGAVAEEGACSGT
jgi:ABC-2 type transport system ATP-binding protein